MKYGLTETTVENICAVFARFPEIEKAILYGSRAKGNFKTGSDIDLMLYGESLMPDLLSAIASALDNLLLPYTIDLSGFDDLSHAKLREHIERVGVVFYERANRCAGMKKGWEVKKLGEVCDFGNGLWTGKNPPFIEVGVIRNTNFTKDCHLDCSDIAFLNVEQSQFAKRKLKYGDIILEKSGGGPKQAVGRVVIFDKHDGDFSFSNFTSLMRVKNPKELNFNYLHKYLFFSYLSRATEKMQSHSTGIRNLKFDEYKQILVPLPPLPEQKRIVGILDKAFAGIRAAKANAEKNLQNARELFESYLQSVFANPGDGFEINRLEDCCDLIVDCEHKTAPVCEEVNTGYYSIRTPNIGKGKLLFENANQVIEKIYKLWTRRGIPEAGDLIFAREAPAGNVAMIPGGIKVCLGQRTVLIRTSKNKLNGQFLVWLILAPRIQEILLHHSRGATVAHVNMKDIRNLSLNSLPPIKEQCRIVNRLDKLSVETKKLEAIYQQKLTDLDELKKSVLQKAFNGELPEVKI